MNLFRGRQIWILEDKIAVNNSPTRVSEIFFALAYLPEAFWVEAGSVG